MSVAADTGALEVAAKTIRAIFITAYRDAYKLRNGRDTDWGARHMATWDGGYSGHKEFAAVWPKIAAICLQHQFDPAAYIAAQFAASEPLVLPNACCGQLAINRYIADKEGIEKRLRFALTSQFQTLRTESTCRTVSRKLNDRDAIESVLSDPTLPLSGLFRYGIADRFVYPKIAAKFREPAMVQYMFRRDDYDLAWASLPIPAGFRELVESAITSNCEERA
jgi:hypothetical protein